MTSVAARTGGTRFRSTGIVGFAGDTVRSVEVCFGWDL